MILFIDNYDSFTYNLVDLLGKMEPDLKVVRNDEIPLDKIAELKPEGIVISPGPGRPEDAGISMDTIEKYGPKIPILGIWWQCDPGGLSSARQNITGTALRTFCI